MVPMNFLPAGQSADYVVTGIWAEKALDEAQRVGNARAAAEHPRARRQLPPRPRSSTSSRSTPTPPTSTSPRNNTIFGTQWHELPDTGTVPLVGDMSSDFLWKPTDVWPFALIYAGAQKNLGPSGVTLVIANKDFLAQGRKDLPKILRYATHAENDSLFNTPPTFAIYLVRNVLAWVKAQGGLAQIEQWNREKAALLYACIDRHPGFYRSPVEQASRSTMNVVFRLPTPALDAQFVEEARKANMVGLKGHRTTGGIRASLYNAVSVRDVADARRVHGRVREATRLAHCGAAARRELRRGHCVCRSGTPRCPHSAFVGGPP